MTTPEQLQIGFKVHAAVIADFRRRGAILRQYSVVIIVLIILVLAAGIGVFIFAGQIANTESNPVVQAKRRTLSALESERQRLEARADARRDELLSFVTKREEEVRRKDGKDPGGTAALAQLYASLIERTQQDLESTSKELQNLEAKRQAASDDLFKAEDAAIERSGVSQSQIPVLVSAFATRVGAVVLLLFLVQILVPLYRYNMKLSSYYDARADALTIISTNYSEGVAGGNEADRANTLTPVRTSVDTIERLVAALSPDGIDFGKAPATPSEHALTIAKEVIASQRK